MTSSIRSKVSAAINADVNGDGLLDVVTANKKGAHYFEQVRK